MYNNENLIKINDLLNTFLNTSSLEIPSKPLIDVFNGDIYNLGIFLINVSEYFITDEVISVSSIDINTFDLFDLEKKVQENVVF